MNDIRASHLVERAAMRLRGELGLESLQAATAPPPLDLLPPADLAPGPAGAPAPEQTVTPTVGIALLQRAGVVMGTGRRTRVVEEFSVCAGTLLRAIRSAQASGPAFLPAGAFANLMLVTSAKPGEGKSFSALNLAATLAHNGLARAVLVDIDPKPGSITTLLGLEGRPGLFDLAENPAMRPDEVVVTTAIRDLSILPLGTRGSAPGGISRKLAAGIERIARRFAGQIVILDAPPCLATSEPSALAPMVGIIAMVVEAERTQREELEHALELVRTCPNVMLLLNKIRGTAGYAFGDYDYYGA